MNNYKLEVHGEQEQILSVTLEDIAHSFNKRVQLNWKILWIDGIANDLFCGSFLDYEKKINESSNGTEISIKELSLLSQKIYELNEVLVIGSCLPEKLKRYSDDLKMIDNCDIVIQLIDTSYWEIYCKNWEWLNIGKLEGIKRVPL